MKNKVHRIAESFTSRISTWERVEAILLGEAADIEIYDPYFTIDLDVYTQGRIPAAAERRDRLTEIESYQSSTAVVDRFLTEEIPVSLHFIDTTAIDELVHRIINGSWAFHEASTNMFYRIERGEVLYSHGGWLAAVRASRAEISEAFWTRERLWSLGAAEKALADLNAAAYRSDDLFFLMSAAKLLRAVAEFLLALNRQFEPSGRMMLQRLKTLAVLPDGFIGNLDNFLRPAEGMTVEVKREIAEHIVRSLIPFGSK